MRPDRLVRSMRNSVRARLTAWNGFILAVTLLAFATVSYALLAHASVDQVDDALRLQLRTLQSSIAAHSPRTDSAIALTEVVSDLHRRGYRVALSEGDTILLVARAVRGERAEAELRNLGTVDGLHAAAVSADLRRRLVARADRARPFTAVEGADRLRVLLASARLAGHPIVLAATEPLGDVDELLAAVRAAFFVLIPAVIVLAVLVGHALARRGLAPIATMTAQAERIGGRTLHERLDVSNPGDELGRLAAAFNAALDRVDAALAQQRQFTADASHELRTPVAVVRSAAEVALAGHSHTTADYRDALTVVVRGSEHLSRVVNDLFLLARADAGQVAVPKAPIYLDELVSDTVRAVRSLAGSKGVDITVIAPEEAVGSGDETLLRRVLLNLLDNAIKYAPPGSGIVVELRTEADGHHLFVTDAGPGVPADARPFVFDRFFRADTARSRGASDYGTGAGLGLSIAREIVSLHGGHLTLVAADGGETTFELLLPAARR